MRIFLSMMILFGALQAQAAPEQTLLNVSYDPTRELFADYNRFFSTYWKEKTGGDVRIRMSHGGSGKQARAIRDGLKADVVSLALGYDIDALAEKNLVAENWQDRLPQHASPYRSLIVLLVRKGNPKQIDDWDDLARQDVSVLTPNPKTSGGARWNYLAAWAYAQKHYDPATAKDFMRTWLGHVKIFDTGARAATTNFVRRGQGDVLITWENEAYVAKHYFGENAFEIVMPSITMMAEPGVAMVDAIAEERGTKKLAEAYLKQLYGKQGQAIIAKNYFRPVQGNGELPPLTDVSLRTIGEMGGWSAMQQEHFADGALFDQLSRRGD